MQVDLPRNSDILIVGAGIVGLSLALELQARGAHVTVLERDTALSHASIAAAGMLAAHDPHNPAALHDLSQFSLSLYPRYLDHIHAVCGQRVLYQTQRTHQYSADGTSKILHEHSIDPRQLAAALLAAVRATSIDLRENTALHAYARDPSQAVIHTTGAWSLIPSLSVTPAKGQMLRVHLPHNLALTEVHRSNQIYIVPRTTGPQAGTALIGATVEDAGFDTTTHPAALEKLRAQAAQLIPQLAHATIAESWAGLRPATPDHLPILGRIADTNDFVATGHFRNGILLAPATARVLADLLGQSPPAIDISPFSPARFLFQAAP